MKEASDITALVFDHGLFVPIAQRLAETYKRVLYLSPWQEAFPQLSKCVIGEVGNVERCDDFWPLLDEIDLFVFPDIQDSGLQDHLSAMGKPVWGSRTGDKVEINRRKFLLLLEELGLEVPRYTVCNGLTDLAEHLIDKEDKYIKVSKFRGDWETGHYRNWQLDQGMIQGIRQQFGPYSEQIPFLVFDPIDTDIEMGVDTFCVNGLWPDVTLHGYEKKDEAYLSAVQHKNQLPDFVKEMMAAFGPVFESLSYCNSMSAEFRVKDDKAYFIDPCCRFPLPGTGSKISLLKNLPEFMWAAANGEMIDLKPSAKFSAEVCLTMKTDKKDWGMVEIPKELSGKMLLSNCGSIDNIITFPPLEFRENHIGWLVSTGNTLQETIDRMLDLAGKLPDGVCANTLLLADLVKEIQTVEAEGIEFADEIPEPAEVVQ